MPPSRGSNVADQLADDTHDEAAEYVLGTLDGEHRRAFEQRLRDDAALRADVAEWERRLVGLSDTTVPVQPPQRVWLAIEDAIAPPPAEPRTVWWQSLAVWRGAAASAALALLVVVLQPLWTEPTVPLPVYNLVVRDAAAQPLWMITCDWRTREYAVTRVAAQPPAAVRACTAALEADDTGYTDSRGLFALREAIAAAADRRQCAAVARCHRRRCRAGGIAGRSELAQHQGPGREPRTRRGFADRCADGPRSARGADSRLRLFPPRLHPFAAGLRISGQMRPENHHASAPSPALRTLACR